ncbi:hypothetical protein EVAR_11754_1 [Eumeta japonica]|uniref:Uncharacterized protein n=1 Tax=Eumeta variegata TaxID=151549 RepID=A0A4C1UPD8_EUMVA|nr:hypothetical protein EVAR_11754_1 [Eumeta japonica]
MVCVKIWNDDLKLLKLVQRGVELVTCHRSDGELGNRLDVLYEARCVLEMEKTIIRYTKCKRRKETFDLIASCLPRAAAARRAVDV